MISKPNNLCSVGHWRPLFSSCNLKQLRDQVVRLGLILICFLNAADSTWAQEDLFLVFGAVKSEEGNKKLEGVRVVVLQDGEQFDVMLTDSKGSYEFELPLRHNYTFSFELEDHSNKRIEVDASGIPESIIGNRNMDLDMTMFEIPAAFDKSILEDPFGKGEYDAEKNTVVFDNNYTVRMRNKVQAEFARLERLAAQEGQLQEQFDEFVKKGDRAVMSREWQNAIDFYDSALALISDDRTVKDKRAQALASLEAVRAEEAARTSASDEEYNDLIEDADTYFEREQFDRAIDLYTEASALKPNERYPIDRRGEAESIKAQLAAEAAELAMRTIEYEGLIDQANELYREDNYEAALANYEAAGEVLPAERFWQQRAEACRERLAEAAEAQMSKDDRKRAEAEREAQAEAVREKQRRYDALTDEADELFSKENYAAAIQKYEAALAVMPDERYPQQRIDESEKRLDEALTANSDPKSDERAPRESAARNGKSDDGADEAADANRLEREAAEAAARAEAEQIETLYSDHIQKADAAFDASNWAMARRSYDEALSVKPDDRYAKSRLDRIEKRMAASSVDSEDNDEDLAAWEAERLAEERDMAEAAEALAAQEEEDRLRRLSDEDSRLAKEEEERKRQAERDRLRAEGLAAQMIDDDDDEVETYFREALESEAKARLMEVEEKKRANAQLLSDASERAAERIEVEEREMASKMREMQAMEESAIRDQQRRVQEENSRQESYRANSQQAQIRGNELVEQGSERVDEVERSRSRLFKRHERDYANRVPELEANKRTWRNLFGSLDRAAADRISESRESSEAMAQSYRRIGRGSSERALQRWQSIRLQEKRESQRLSNRQREAQRRAYEQRLEREESIKAAGPRDPEEYKLSEADIEVQRGVHEQSYDIPNGLVIERTVRVGNKVVRYRKVVTKTGVYYFKGDRSITAETWKRETTLVLD